jgi:tetratricopeptide (TPR) repeat protein
LEAGQLPEAQKSFEQALALIPEKIPDGPLPDHDKLWQIVHDAAIGVGPFRYRRDSRVGLACVFLAAGRTEEATETFRQALIDDERYHGALQAAGLLEMDLDFAWFLLTCPVKEIRDPERALVKGHYGIKYAINILANQTAVPHTVRKLAAQAWKIRALGSYQEGGWKACDDALEESKRNRPLDVSALFLRAMAQWQLDKKKEAVGLYNEGVKWMQTNRPKDLELRRFRAEAAELLGIKE